MRRLALLLFGLMLPLAGAAAAERLPARTSSAAGVTVKVQPLAGTPIGSAFEVTFDTHSQELKDDLVKSAVLVPDAGAPLAPAAWQGDPAGGHHRKGVLRFDAITPAPTRVELRIHRAGEPAPRVFRWEIR